MPSLSVIGSLIYRDGAAAPCVLHGRVAVPTTAFANAPGKTDA